MQTQQSEAEQARSLQGTVLGSARGSAALSARTLPGSIMDFDLLERVEEEKEEEDGWVDAGPRSSRRGTALRSDQDEVVSPYAIKNLTEGPIVIQKQLTEDEILRREREERKRNRQRIVEEEPSALPAIVEDREESQAVDGDSDGGESNISLPQSINTSITN